MPQREIDRLQKIADKRAAWKAKVAEKKAHRLKPKTYHLCQGRRYHFVRQPTSEELKMRGSHGNKLLQPKQRNFVNFCEAAVPNGLSRNEVLELFLLVDPRKMKNYTGSITFVQRHPLRMGLIELR